MIEHTTCDEKPPLTEAIELMWRLLRDIGADLKDLNTMKQRSLREGFAFLTKTLPSLGKAFDRGLGDSAFKLPSAFKKWRKSTEIPAFLGSLFRSVFHCDGALREDADPTAVSHIRQVCFIFYKYELPPDDRSVDKSFQAWIETDTQLPTEFPEEDGRLEVASRFAAEIFGDFAVDGLNFRHGPGAVSDSTRAGKYFVVPSPFDSCISHFGAHTFMLHIEAQRLFTLVAIVFILCMVLELPYGEVLPQVFPGSLYSSLIAVPKDSRGPRLINKEPVIHQWYQQGIMAWTVKRLESHKKTSGAVNFTNQEVNRLLAIEASMTLDLATIDLKEASDRVTIALVKRVFSKCPEYLRVLEITRTERSLVRFSDGTQKTIEIKKFAAMGSALCFTTLAFVIYALVYADLTERGWSSDMINQSIKVYGDDIICPKAAYPAIKACLENYGLKVNGDKSFVGSPFAESCGMDAFRGNKVTPVRVRSLLKKHTTRVKLKWIKDPAKAEVIVKTAKLAFQLAKRGYSLSSEYCYSLVESQLGAPLPFGTEASPYLCRVVNSHEVARLNRASGLSRWKPAAGFYEDSDSTASGSIDRLRRNAASEYKEVVRGYGIIPRTLEFEENPYVRLRRVLPLMGLGAKGGALPEWGFLPDRGFCCKARPYEICTHDPQVPGVPMVANVASTSEWIKY